MKSSTLLLSLIIVTTSHQMPAMKAAQRCIVKNPYAAMWAGATFVSTLHNYFKTDTPKLNRQHQLYTHLHAALQKYQQELTCAVNDNTKHVPSFFSTMPELKSHWYEFYAADHKTRVRKDLGLQQNTQYYSLDTQFVENLFALNEETDIARKIALCQALIGSCKWYLSSHNELINTNHDTITKNSILNSVLIGGALAALKFVRR